MRCAATAPTQRTCGVGRCGRLHTYMHAYMHTCINTFTSGAFVMESRASCIEYREFSVWQNNLGAARTSGGVIEYRERFHRFRWNLTQRCTSRSSTRSSTRMSRLCCAAFIEIRLAWSIVGLFWLNIWFSDVISHTDVHELLLDAQGRVVLIEIRLFWSKIGLFWSKIGLNWSNFTQWYTKHWSTPAR